MTTGAITMITFDAHFDGEHLCPETPLNLPTNVRLRVTVSEHAEGNQGPKGEGEEPLGLFGRLFDGETVEGPEDWSQELDHYLYGTPKRGDDPSA
jgi:hypothetical protein